MKTRTTLALSLAIAAAAGLSACGKDDNTTAGQKVDAAIQKTERAADTAATRTERAADTAAARTGEAVRDAGQAASDAAAGVASSVSDSMITGSVKTKLAADTELSALKIDVDTAYGKVTLTGTAPTDAAKDRATTIAKATDGVKDVDNKLVVTAK
jgi:hyperosmotically inducible protein